MKEKTKKITVSLTENTLKLAGENIQKLGFDSRSELLETALREYLGGHLLQDFAKEIAKAYSMTERSELKNMEEHMAKLSFKIAVELAQANLLFASLIDYSDEEIRLFRSRAVSLVKQSRGYVPLKTAKKFVAEGVGE